MNSSVSRFFQVIATASCAALWVVAEAVAQVPPGVAAPGTAPATPSLWDALVQMLPMLAICYLIFYFMVIRPQESKNKQLRTLLESIKRGDSVVTSSGIVGKVAGVEKDHVQLEIAPNVKVKFLLTAITRLEGEPQKSKAA
jgi:preprotein translocase subunit YajC